MVKEGAEVIVEGNNTYTELAPLPLPVPNQIYSDVNQLAVYQLRNLQNTTNPITIPATKAKQPFPLTKIRWEVVSS